MIILIAIVPMRFALDHTKDPVILQAHISTMHSMLAQVDTIELAAADKAEFRKITSCIDSLSVMFTGVTSFDNLSRIGCLTARRDLLVVSKKSETLMKHLSDNQIKSADHIWIRGFRSQVKEIKTYTEYSPWWVILLISFSLGLGTMVGWKRIVITIGEKIGKTHLTYAQGATAELIAASTISASSWLGLPVSTTHVLSSGVAGAMVSGNGIKNLQKKTVASIGIAWLITLPVTILLSGLLFLLFRVIFI
jgi:PiT family inorganic phosphate transporter